MSAKRWNSILNQIKSQSVAESYAYMKWTDTHGTLSWHMVGKFTNPVPHFAEDEFCDTQYEIIMDGCDIILVGDGPIRNVEML